MREYDQVGSGLRRSFVAMAAREEGEFSAAL
jgi:hypothetical protein